MEKFTFYKYSGHGNDFVIVDNWEGQVPEKDMGKIARLMCRPKLGVGADGAVFITAGPDEVDFAWRYFKADGNEEDISGNGCRCAAHLANSIGIAPSEMSFKTKAGVVDASIDGHQVKVRLPKLGRPEGAALVETEGLSLTYHRLNMGLPQAVAWVEELDSLNVPRLGQAVRRHPAFAPEGANINFVKILGPDKLALRSYARGVEDEVLSSGSGAAAALILGTAQGLLSSRSLSCRTRSGEELSVSFDPETGDQVCLEGRVRFLFSGQVEADLFLK